MYVEKNITSQVENLTWPNLSALLSWFFLIRKKVYCRCIWKGRVSFFFFIFIQAFCWYSNRLGSSLSNFIQQVHEGLSLTIVACFLWLLWGLEQAWYQKFTIYWGKKDYLIFFQELAWSVPSWVLALFACINCSYSNYAQLWDSQVRLYYHIRTHQNEFIKFIFFT